MITCVLGSAALQEKAWAPGKEPAGGGGQGAASLFTLPNLELPAPTVLFSLESKGSLTCAMTKRMNLED